ncbi:MAG: amidohydrolase family protein [Bacteroidia bacterium]
MQLCNLWSVEDNQLVDISIEGSSISEVLRAQETPVTQENMKALHFENAIVFPGLINSHDHLDFNCFPQLANKTYNNYVEWGADIHLKNKEVIAKVLKIPLHLRVEWGIYKNLLNGFTTVVNHGPKLVIEKELIHVFQRCHILHSIQLEKNWKYKLNNPFRKKLPFVIHIGEGTDASVNEEIDKLLQWNIWKREIIGIHGIAMNAKQAKAIKALVWCPASNLFLIGRTADIDKLKIHTKILFGTDSTISADCDFWEHLKLARNLEMAKDEEIFQMLTTNAADVWNLENTGKLKKNNSADVVIAKVNDKNKTALNAFFAVQPEDILLVIHKGNIRLFDATLYANFTSLNIDTQHFYNISLNGSEKYVAGNLPALIAEIKNYYPEAEFPVN